MMMKMKKMKNEPKKFKCPHGATGLHTGSQIACYCTIVSGFMGRKVAIFRDQLETRCPLVSARAEKNKRTACVHVGGHACRGQGSAWVA